MNTDFIQKVEHSRSKTLYRELSDDDKLQIVQFETRVNDIVRYMDGLVDKYNIFGWDNNSNQVKVTMYPDVVDMSFSANGIDVSCIKNQDAFEDALRSVYSGKNVLDLGSGNGGLYHPFLTFFGGNVVGIDSDQNAVEVGQHKGAHLIQLNIRDISTIKDRYPIILANKLYCDKHLQNGDLAGPEFVEAISKLDENGFFIATGLDLYVNPIIFEEYFDGKGLLTDYRMRHLITADLSREKRDSGDTVGDMYFLRSIPPQQAFMVRKTPI